MDQVQECFGFNRFNGLTTDSQTEFVNGQMGIMSAMWTKSPWAFYPLSGATEQQD